jgi:hypothetical protein
MDQALASRRSWAAHDLGTGERQLDDLRCECLQREGLDENAVGASRFGPPASTLRSPTEARNIFWQRSGVKPQAIGGRQGERSTVASTSRIHSVLSTSTASSGVS